MFVFIYRGGHTITQVMKQMRINLMNLVQGDSSMMLNCWNGLIETLLPKDSTVLQMRNEENNWSVGLYIQDMQLTTFTHGQYLAILT